MKTGYLLPPLPDVARLDGPGHLTDSARLVAYALALAESHKLVLDPMPLDPVSGEAGHVAWHNTFRKALANLAAALKVQVELPPETVAVDGAGHVDHHNLFREALVKMTEDKPQPFSMKGGREQQITYEGATYNLHIFDAPGVDTLEVTGTGEAGYVAVAGGGGHGGTVGSTYDPMSQQQVQARGGAGGAGGVDTSESIFISAGLYTVQVGSAGTGGSDGNTAGGDGGQTSITGPDDFAVQLDGGGHGGAARSASYDAIGDGGDGWAGGGACMVGIFGQQTRGQSNGGGVASQMGKYDQGDPWEPYGGGAQGSAPNQPTGPGLGGAGVMVSGLTAAVVDALPLTGKELGRGGGTQGLNTYGSGGGRKPGSIQGDAGRQGVVVFWYKA